MPVSFDGICPWALTAIVAHVSRLFWYFRFLQIPPYNSYCPLSLQLQFYAVFALFCGRNCIFKWHMHLSFDGILALVWHLPDWRKYPFAATANTLYLHRIKFTSYSTFAPFKNATVVWATAYTPLMAYAPELWRQLLHTFCVYCGTFASCKYPHIILTAHCPYSYNFTLFMHHSVGAIAFYNGTCLWDLTAFLH